MPSKPKRASLAPSPYDNFLYLLMELEQAVERGNIRWPAGAVNTILGRLGGIAQHVTLAANGNHPPQIH